MAGNKRKQGQVIGMGERVFNAVMIVLGIVITFIALYHILCIDLLLQQAFLRGEWGCAAEDQRIYHSQL